jgi:hypothetical protein
LGFGQRTPFRFFAIGSFLSFGDDTNVRVLGEERPFQLLRTEAVREIELQGPKQGGNPILDEVGTCSGCIGIETVRGVEPIIDIATEIAVVAVVVPAACARGRAKTTAARIASRGGEHRNKPTDNRIPSHSCPRRRCNCCHGLICYCQEVKNILFSKKELLAVVMLSSMLLHFADHRNLALHTHSF